MKIDEFKTDDQDTHDEKTKQNEETIKVSTSRNAVNGSEVYVDGESPHGENLEQINSQSGYCLGKAEDNGRLKKSWRTRNVIKMDYK